MYRYIQEITVSMINLMKLMKVSWFSFEKIYLLMEKPSIELFKIEDYDINDLR